MNRVAFTLCVALCSCRDGSGDLARSANAQVGQRAGANDATATGPRSLPHDDAATRPVAPQPLRTKPTVTADWCIDKVDALDQSACYVLPERPTQTLLIYLSGIVPPERDSPQKSHVETVVANAVRRAGIAALLPRGKQGLAPKGRDLWWGWPTTDASYREYGGAMVSAFAEQRKKLEEIAGVSFTRVYVAGSSSGAYFAVRLALRGAIDAHGFGAISGGAVPDVTGLDRLEPRPFYIGYGKGEAAVRSSAVALAHVLRRAKWPVRTSEQPLDHGAHEVYLDEAIAFWREHDRD
jgi:predicted esterase